MAASSIVFDIETLGFPLDSFDEIQQEYLLKFADSDEKRELEIQKFALSAFTGKIIAIGMMNPDTLAGKVCYQGDTKEEWTSPDGKVQYVACSESEMLVDFWNTIPRFKNFITFNGRSFDCPFITHRSMILGVKPSRNINTYRFSVEPHCDLLEQLTVYGATRKYNLDFYCKAFDIKSPKSDGVTGLQLGGLFEEKKFREIATYCAGDIHATCLLYKKVMEPSGSEG
ncbi:MAG TPA: ribonuclease H-like domain-containing protein [Bacteroidota bacterium]|nr:ribonuclease H-like domain-containing protein [Bacteroidota bacterium]